MAVIATESHLQTILQRLEADGVDVVGAIDERRYIPLDVDETLSTFMVKDKPDPVRFQKAVGNLFSVAKGEKGEDRRVAACGETAPTAWAEGKAEDAVQIEHFWVAMYRLHDVENVWCYLLQRQPDSETRVAGCIQNPTFRNSGRCASSRINSGSALSSHCPISVSFQRNASADRSASPRFGFH